MSSKETQDVGTLGSSQPLNGRPRTRGDNQQWERAASMALGTATDN